MPRLPHCPALLSAACLITGCIPFEKKSGLPSSYLAPNETGVTTSTVVGLHSWPHYDDPSDNLLPAKMLVERRWDDWTTYYVSAERRVIGAPSLDSEHFHEYLLGRRSYWYPIRGFRLYQNLGLGYREFSGQGEGLAFEFGFGVHYSRGQWHWDLQINQPLHELFTNNESVRDSLEVGIGIGFKF